MKYNLITIRPPNFMHSSGFHELQESLGWALSALGNEVTVQENAFPSGGINIVFGAELFNDDQQLPPHTWIYNLEQSSHPKFNNIIKLGGRATGVWEYSAANMPHWKSAGVSATNVPFGYTPNLTRIPKAFNQDISVFFSGWITPRRQKIIDELRAHGLNVVAVSDCYGGGRDQLLSRSKIALNINHDGRNRTNIQRLSFWMANSKCIVSETSSDMHDYDDLLPSIVMERYDGLVEMCRNLIDHGRIDEMGHDAFEAIKKRDYVTTVAKALESQPASNPILERYERGCREGDMKEHLPWLRKNVRGHCLEIGVRDGASTSALILGAAENDAFVTSVDISGSCDLFSHDRWTFYKADSKSLNYHDNVFDCAFIDGDHSEIGFTADLHNCYRWVRAGGWIACHDVTAPRTYESHGGDFPSIAVGEKFKNFCTEKGLVNFYLPSDNSIGVLVVKK
jgi:hypothetical protein